MAQDLLAPPKFKPRNVALGLAIASVFPIGLGIFQVTRGFWSWTQLAWRIGLLIVFCAAIMVGYSWLARCSKRLPPERMPFVHAGIAMLMGVVFVFLMTVTVQGTILGQSSPGYLFMLPMMVGMVLAQGGWGRRIGESKHCPTCEYEFTFSETQAPSKCPECGTPWLGMLRKGRRVKSVKMMVWGILIAIVGAILFQPIFWLGPLAKILPTPILYTALYIDPKSSFDAWDELSTRTLSPTSTEALARRISEHRLKNQWGSGGDNWFDAAAAAGKFPKEIQERHFREALITEMEVPREVAQGKPFSVRFRTSRAVEGFSTKLGVMFAGYSVDGGEPVGQAAEPTWGYQLRPSPLQRTKPNFDHELTIDAPGRHTIRATYWVIFQPSFWTIAWGPDGTPVRPGAATWFERVDVEREVIVK